MEFPSWQQKTRPQPSCFSANRISESPSRAPLTQSSLFLCHTVFVILFEGRLFFHYCLVDLHAKVSSRLFDSHKHLISLFQADY